MTSSLLKGQPRSSWPTPHVLSSVRGRILSGIGLIVVILVAVAAGFAWQVSEHRSTTDALQDHAEITFLLLDARANAESAAASVQRYVLVGDEVIAARNDATLLSVIDESTTTALDDLTRALALEKAQGDEEAVAVLTAILVEATALVQGAGQLIALRETDNIAEATAVYEGLVPEFREFESKINELADQERAQAVALRSEAHQAGTLAPRAPVRTPP